MDEMIKHNRVLELNVNITPITDPGRLKQENTHCRSCTNHKVSKQVLIKVK